MRRSGQFQNARRRLLIREEFHDARAVLPQQVNDGQRARVARPQQDHERWSARSAMMSMKSWSKVTMAK